MSSEDDIELPQTQSQSLNTEDQDFSQNADEGREIWGQLKAKHKSLHDFGMILLLMSYFDVIIGKFVFHC